MRSPLRALTENWQLKLLALALAVLLWVVVSAEQVTSQWIPVPLQINETDPDFELVSTDIPTEVDVRFTGSGRDLVDVAIRKPPLVLSVSRVEGPSQEFQLQPSMVQMPSQLAVNAQEVRAPVVRLTFRRLAARTLPIQPVMAAEEASEWMLVDTLQVLPRQVELRGPAERVETVDAVRTLPFDLPAADSGFSTIVQIDTTNLRGIDLSVTQVRVSGRVDRVVQRRLVDVPISVGPGVVVRPAAVDVTVIGPRSVVEAVRAQEFRVVIAIDTIPSFIPLEGLSVPVRVEQVRRGLRTSVAPPAVRLLRPGAGDDTIGAPRAAADTARTPARE